MIINTGSRTDVPAFFSEWFYNRIKEEYILLRNPYFTEVAACSDVNIAGYIKNKKEKERTQHAIKP